MEKIWYKIKIKTQRDNRQNDDNHTFCLARLVIYRININVLQWFLLSQWARKKKNKEEEKNKGREREREKQKIHKCRLRVEYSDYRRNLVGFATPWGQTDKNHCKFVTYRFEYDCLRFFSFSYCVNIPLLPLFLHFRASSSLLLLPSSPFFLQHCNAEIMQISTRKHTQAPVHC